MKGNYAKPSQHYCDILVLFHCVTTGNISSELLGSDDSDIAVLVWQLIDLNQNQTGDIHYIYVQPPINSRIRKEWTEATGITEEMLNNAPTFEDAVHQFEQTLRNELNDQGKTCSFTLCTDGQCHLRQVLMPASVRWETKLPDFCFSFFDLKKEFRQCYGSYMGQMEVCGAPDAVVAPISVPEMLNCLNVTLEEFGTFGVDQVRQMSSIIQILISEQYGYVFTSPERIVDRLETGPCMTSDLIMDETVVRARGLPWQASDHDVAKFFKGLNIPRGGAALVLNPQGRRNGEALVRFENIEQRDLALLRHKHYMGNRYIEVYRASAEEFLKVATGTSCEAIHFLSKESDAIVRIRGLPFCTTSQDIIDFFGDDAPVAHGEDGVLFVKYADGRFTGDAFVLFADETVASEALAKHKQTLGKRYVEIFKSTAAEVQQVLSRHMASPLLPATMPASMQIALIPNGQHTLASAQTQVNQSLQSMMNPGSVRNCIRLRGMPYSATIEDIMAFLAELSVFILPHGIHMVLNQQGRPSGDAFIQLMSPEKASQAGLDVSKGGCHKKHMGERYVEVFQCSGDEMNLVLMGGTLNRNGMVPPPGMTILPPEPLVATTPSVQVPQIMTPTSPAMTSPLLIQTPHGTLLMQPSIAAAPTAAQYPTLDLLQSQALLASPRNALYAPPAYLPCAQYLPTPPVSPTANPATPVSTLAGAVPVSTPTGGVPGGTIAISNCGIQVRMQGMPYQAGVPDILSFFKGYNINSSSIKLLYNDKLRPTGEALVTFPTLEDAHRAVVENNRKPMGNRYVELLLM